MARKELIILGSSETALGVVRNAYNINLKPVVFDSVSGIATKSVRARVVLQEGRTWHELLDVLVDLGQGGSNYLVATSDDWLRFIVQHRTMLDRAYKFVFHPDNDVLTTCLQKQRFSMWCREHSLSIPKFYTREELRQLISPSANFPMIIRPTETLHGETDQNIPKAIEVHDSRELQYWLERYDEEQLEPFVCESLLGKDLTQYSVALARASEKMISFVSRKIRPGSEYCAVGSYVELCRNEEVERLAQKVFDLLNYYGIGEVEILYSGETGMYYIIEINARPWTQYSLSVASGNDFLQFMLDPDTYDESSEIKEGKSWLDFRSDLYICFSRDKGMVRKGKVSLFDYVVSLLRANVFMLFEFSDPRPFWFNCKEMVKAIFGMRS